MAVARRTNGESKKESLRLVIVDDHVFMRDLMARMLARQRTRYAVLAAVGTATEAIAACAQLQPHLLILDINLPDRNGIDALPDVRRVAPATRILLCTGFPTDDRISNLAGTGAHGFVEKTNSWDGFLEAIERISNGEYYFCSGSAGLRRESSNATESVAPYLTPREKEIIGLIAQGQTSKDIAAKLYISVATVETHRTNIMMKLDVKNAAGLVSYAFRKRLIRHGATGPSAHSPALR